MKILILMLMFFNPFKPVIHAVKAVGHEVAHVTSTVFYKTTNFFVNHIQPNQKGDPGKTCH